MIDGAAKTVVFFSNRHEGVNHSHPEAAWRLGSGNVFTTLAQLPEGKHADEFSPAEQEYINVIENLKTIVDIHAPEAEHQVLLNSQYGKGISVVDPEFLNTDCLKRDPSGRIIIDGDGLFTEMPNALLLNKSGDAHAIVFESPTAVGIIVGSWMGISKGLLSGMLEYFLARHIQPEDITIHIGPGLGNNSYDMGKDVYQKVLAENEAFEDAFTIKHRKEREGIPQRDPKYVLNMVKLVQIANEPLGMKINANSSANTFDRDQWHVVRQNALETQNPEMLKAYYANPEKVPYFSARLHSRMQKYMQKVKGEETWSSDAGAKSGTYGDTGRCLNGVMRCGK